MFHVKHPKTLYFEGIPAFNRRTATTPWCAALSKPALLTGSVAHRERSESGGSETIREPPSLRKGRARRAVYPGDPSPRHTTTSYIPAWRTSRPRTPASAVSTVVRSSSPKAETALARASIRDARRSTNVTESSGRSTAITRPGTPAPDPRSMTDCAPGSMASTKWRAWAMTSSTGH